MEKRKIEAQALKYAKRGKFLDAVSEYQKLLTGKESDIPIQNIIGDLYIKADLTKQAVVELKKVANYYNERGLFSRSIALYKRITKLDPDDTEAAGMLADLYLERGFISDAKKEYRKLALRFQNLRQDEEAIEYLNRLLRADPNDIGSRITLADIHQKNGEMERAVEELNTAAEQEILQEEYKKAGQFLSQARALKEDDSRTLKNSIRLYLKKDKKKQAFELLNELLNNNKNNTAALHLLGDLSSDEGRHSESMDLFKRIIELKPNDVNAQVKLGQVYVIKKQPDRAFEILEPLVDKFLNKKKSSKAIGLLGLILSYSYSHLPSLNKLASVYDSLDQPGHLAIVYRVILKEYQNQQKQKASLSVLKRLHKLIPGDADINSQYNRLKEELGVQEDRKEAEKRTIHALDAEEIIKNGMKKIDLLVEQGLLRNAERILSQLQLSFPSDQRIGTKKKELKQISSRIREEEISAVVKNLSGQGDLSKTRPKDSEDRIWSSAEIFSGTDLDQGETPQDRKLDYFDLSQIVEEELRSIRDLALHPVKGYTAILEKELGEIVKEFRRGIESKVGQDDFESRYTLGIAFLEQELFYEAIEEFKIASRDDQFKMDSYCYISLCHKKINDLNGAIQWIKKAQELTEKTSDRDWALKYEIAQIYEEKKEIETALKLYGEIAAWNPNYRNALRKIEELKK